MDTSTPNYDSGSITWILCPGLGLFYSGLARAKNALSLMFLTMIAVSVVSFQWFFWGYSLAFSETGGPFIGNLAHVVGKNVGWNAHPNAPTIPSSTFFIFQLMVACITSSLAFGASAERMRMGPSILLLFIWSTLVYNFTTYWIWAPNGWLSVRGIMDYAGGTPVHISSGSTAVAYALVLGKRKDYGKTAQPHNVSLVYIGTGLLWFGWFGFNGGSALAANARAVQAMINTHLAGSVGGLVWMMLDYRRERKLSLVGYCTGAIAGLVTITPGCGYVSGASSLIFGLLGSALCNMCVAWKSKYHFDDALDVFAVHYVGGFVGLLLTGIFAEQSIIGLSYPAGATDVPLGGFLDGDYHRILIQLAAIGSVTAWSFCITYVILSIMNRIPGLHLRLDEDGEEMGTDMAEIGETAYGFMLKSMMDSSLTVDAFHLRAMEEATPSAAPLQG
ncbi:ammonium transporter, Amt family [Entomortierella parvispora]|uniref:Ammonium transporter n=1 Tax=Entomortierella parvispora TaxID=205924 RepID=A0A9P3HF90_9FUNG|nr:ammonium transporter, Amt family [Entomortierella parvispora]